MSSMALDGVSLKWLVGAELDTRLFGSTTCCLFLPFALDVSYCFSLLIFLGKA